VWCAPEEKNDARKIETEAQKTQGRDAPRGQVFARRSPGFAEIFAAGGDCFVSRLFRRLYAGYRKNKPKDKPSDGYPFDLICQAQRIEHRLTCVLVRAG